MLAFGVLGVAVMFGLALSAALMLPDVPLRPRILGGYAHGAIGIAGFVVLLAALARAAPHVSRSGTGSFGTMAMALLAATVLAGVLVFIGHQRRRPAGAVVVALHATLAVAGYVMLAAYISVG
jgi:hypothetical protein